MNRDDMISAMAEADTLWDVLVIGGGATGLGAALEAVSRGHRTALVEARDFASGTSSRSTKLIHGGVRYLRQGRIGMVRQSLQERGRLLRNAPHLVHPIHFVLPVSSRTEQWYYFAGLKLYDALGGRSGFSPARRLSAATAFEYLPGLSRDRCEFALEFSDGQFDDARLAITLAQTAVDHGAVLANYLPVVSLIREHSRIRGVVVRDEETGRELQLKAKVVINAQTSSSWILSIHHRHQVPEKRPTKSWYHPVRVHTWCLMNRFFRGIML
jgi:glycerol-3-phosphate dehydrogenase